MIANAQALRTEIERIEAEAPSLGTDKVALYDLLVKAYFHQKDLIAILEAQQPEKETIIDTDEIDRLTFELDELNEKLVSETTERKSAEHKLNILREILCPSNPADIQED